MEFLELIARIATHLFKDTESEDFDRALKKADKFLKNYIADELGEDV